MKTRQCIAYAMVPLKVHDVGFHVSRHSGSYQSESSCHWSGVVDNEDEFRKTEKQAQLTSQYQFIPIEIEMLGPVGVEATVFFQEL